MNRLKIAIVIERIETWRGGAETSTMELARQLLRRGHEVHIVTASRSPSPPDLVIHSVSTSTTLRPLRTAAFARKATALIEGETFDVVHSVVPLPSADYYQPRGGLLRETLERNVAMRATRSRRLFKRALARMSVKQQSLADLERDVFQPNGPSILAVSQYVARQCEKHYGVKSPRVRVVFNGVSIHQEDAARRQADRRAIRTQYRLSDETLVLLFVAHNLRLKGMDPLIAASERLVKTGVDDFVILVVGRDNPVRYSQRVENLGLMRHVIFTGPTQRVGAFYHAADVSVHPTYYDPCSRVVLEALARGLPCVTTRFNGAAEVMTDGREGFVIDTPDSVDDLADRIAKLRSPDLRGTMSQRAMELRERISMVRHVDELEAVYRDSVGRRHRAKSAC